MRAYRTLLKLYPSGHRNEYGSLMQQAFNDRTRDAGYWTALREASL